MNPWANAIEERKNKAWLRELKDNASCKKCGYSKKTHKDFNSRALQFHHKDDNKEFEISNGTNWGLSKKRIQKEMEKCDILCARSQKEVKYARKVKLGQNALLIHTQAHTQILLLLNTAKTLTMPRNQRVEKERASNG